MLRRRKKSSNILGKKEQSKTTIKTNNSYRGNKSERSGERRKTKKIPRQDQTMQIKETFQNNERKICQLVRRECMKTFQQPGVKQFWREHKKNAEWINNLENELQRFGEGLTEKIHPNLLRATLKKYQIGKHQTMMAYIDSGEKCTFFYDRQAIKIKKCL